MSDYINRQARQMARAACSKTEVNVLSGCTNCGRRVVHNDMPIPGAVLVQFADDPVKKPFCQACFNTLLLKLPPGTARPATHE